MVQYKDTHDAESVRSDEVKELWLQLLIQFFEKKILWKREVQFIENNQVFELNQNDNVQRGAGIPIANGNNQTIKHGDNQPIENGDNQLGDPVEIKCGYFYSYLLC